MIYGLLNLKIRGEVPRDKFKTFEELLKAARNAEEHLAEKQCSSREKKREWSNSNYL